MEICERGEMPFVIRYTGQVMLSNNIIHSLSFQGLLLYTLNIPDWCTIDFNYSLIINYIIMEKSWYLRRGKSLGVEFQINTNQFGVGIAVAKDGFIVALAIFYVELTFKR